MNPKSFNLKLLTLIAIIYSGITMSQAVAAKSLPRKACVILAEDQADRDSKNPDRSSRKIDWAIVKVRDAKRQSEMRALLKIGRVGTATEYFCASEVMQHSDDAESIDLAHALAVLSYTLDPTVENTRYMVAATQDRYLQKMGRGQWYGTQYGRDKDGKLYQMSIESSAINDDARRRMSVPTLEEAANEIQEMNK
jgi:hypothetical protein